MKRTVVGAAALAAAGPVDQCLQLVRRRFDQRSSRSEHGRQGQDHHRLAAERREDRLAGGRRTRPTQRFEKATGAKVNVAVAAVVELHDQAGLHLRRQQRHPGRRRAGQHPDRVLHRGRRVRRPERRQGRLRELGHLAQGAHRVRHVPRRQAAWPSPTTPAAASSSTARTSGTRPASRPRRRRIDELNADLDKVKAANSSDPHFSAFYMPGKYWYAAMSLVYGAGGKIAEHKDGKWVGRARQLAGRSRAWPSGRSWRLTYSVGGATLDESTQDAVMAQGHVAAIVGNGWEVGAVTDTEDRRPEARRQAVDVPVPGHGGGQVHAVLPRRLGPRRPAEGEERRPRRRVDQVLHRHGQPDRARQVRDPEHHLAAERVREAVAGEPVDR